MFRVLFLLGSIGFILQWSSAYVGAFQPLRMFNSSDITNLEYQKVLQSLEQEGEMEAEALKVLAPAYHGVDNKFRAQKAVYRMKKIIQANRDGTKSNFVQLMTEIQLKLLSDYKRELKSTPFHKSTFHDLTRVLNYVNQKIAKHLESSKKCPTCKGTKDNLA